MKRLFWAIIVAVACAGWAYAENRIVISKKDYKLYVIDSQDKVIFQTDVCLGKNTGNKKRRGDHKTPEGSFKIISIENSSHWPDFDKVFRASYGPWFMRLNVPGFRSIGLHGTNEPESIGTRASMGCVRMLNDKALELKELVKVGTSVKILPEGQPFKP